MNHGQDSTNDVWSETYARRLVGAFVLLAAYSSRTVPLFEIGNTAVTDHVFVWGADGLSVWYPSALQRLLSLIQEIGFGLTIISALIVIAAPRSGRTLSAVGIAAFAAASSCSFASCIHAISLAHEINDVLPLYSSLSRVAGMTLLSAICAALSLRETGVRARADASSHRQVCSHGVCLCTLCAIKRAHG
jgi:hypothetical protein